MKTIVKRPVHCRVQSSAKCHYRFQKCLWEENKGKTYGKCSICLVSTSAEAPWAWPVVCHVFLFFPETQIRQEALSFEEVHGHGYKQAALQKVTFETLLSSWKFETREVSELIRGSLCLLKSLHLCLLRCSWHPHAEPCIRSVSAPSYQQSAPHLFLAFVSW